MEGVITNTETCTYTYIGTCPSLLSISPPVKTLRRSRVSLTDSDQLDNDGGLRETNVTKHDDHGNDAEQRRRHIHQLPDHQHRHVHPIDVSEIRYRRTPNCPPGLITKLPPARQYAYLQRCETRPEHPVDVTTVGISKRVGIA